MGSLINTEWKTKPNCYLAVIEFGGEREHGEYWQRMKREIECYFMARFDNAKIVHSDIDDMDDLTYLQYLFRGKSYNVGWLFFSDIVLVQPDGDWGVQYDYVQSISRDISYSDSEEFVFTGRLAKVSVCYRSKSSLELKMIFPPSLNDIEYENVIKSIQGIIERRFPSCKILH